MRSWAKMRLINRLVVVGWMLGGLLVAGFILALGVFLGYGLVAWWARPAHMPPWVGVFMLWSLRITLCASIWVVAKGAARAAGPQGPSRATLTVAALAGLVVGLVSGVAIRNAWGLRVVSILGLPPESFVEDVVLVVVVGAYAAFVFGATYLPKKGVVSA